MDNPRIVTLDPTGSVGRIVRGALELLDLSPVQIDCPTEVAARAEIERGATLLVIAEDLAGESGADLAFTLATDMRELPVIVLADEDAEFADDMPYLVLHRASDAIRIIKAIDAALSAKDVRAALRKTAAIPLIVEQDNGGSVPGLDLEHAKRILDELLVEVRSLACILATRKGELLVERGMVNGLERERLISMIAPTMKMGREVKEVVGGQLSTIQFFDGEAFDIFVLSVGLHHFLCIIYDGNGGARQFGSVNRFGRRAAEDVIALVGANAFIWQSPHPIEQVASPSRSTTRVKAVKVERPAEAPLEMPIARAELEESESGTVADETPAMEPITDLDLDVLFGSDFSGDDTGDLFNMDALEDLSKLSPHGKGKLDWDQAKEIGLIS